MTTLNFFEFPFLGLENVPIMFIVNVLSEEIFYMVIVK